MPSFMRLYFPYRQRFYIPYKDYTTFLIQTYEIRIYYVYISACITPTSLQVHMAHLRLEIIKSRPRVYVNSILY